MLSQIISFSIFIENLLGIFTVINPFLRKYKTIIEKTLNKYYNNCLSNGFGRRHFFSIQ